MSLPRADTLQGNLYYVFNPTPNPLTLPAWRPYPFLWREFLVMASFGVGLFIIHYAAEWARARAAKKNGGRCAAWHESMAAVRHRCRPCQSCMSPLPPQCMYRLPKCCHP